ncbi:MAG: hypothetical protein HDR05_05175 [Lachnospiraceae bacterium]|nr:hypothetical protein [Lachnospiraceae bacterium]
MFEILTIICAIFVWIAYHKLFSVFYFDLGRGLIKEFIISLFGGAVIAYLIMNFWFIAIPIIIFIVYRMLKK